MTRADETPAAWERYRAHLAVLARLRVDPRLCGKLDLSGIVQHTLLEAHLTGGAWKAATEAQRLAWLRRALANNLADELRRWAAAKRGGGRERSLEEAAARSSIRLQEWAAADVSSPSDQAIRHEEELALAEALGTLPDAQREALILQHWHGWSLAEIGAQMGRTPAAVAGLIKRGLAGLRARMPSGDNP
jgi:RNA polymerase sigma-70 factor (ECF subfamily)